MAEANSAKGTVDEHTETFEACRGELQSASLLLLVLNREAELGHPRRDRPVRRIRTLRVHCDGKTMV